MCADVGELTPWTSDEIDLIKQGKWLVLMLNVSIVNVVFMSVICVVVEVSVTGYYPPA